MKALCWNGRDLEFTSTYRAPVGGAQTALVKVHLAGICATDPNFTGVPGHEFVGSVVTVAQPGFNRSNRSGSSNRGGTG